MQIEAVKVDNGFFIPSVDGLKDITSQTVLLDVMVITSGEDEIDRFFDRYQIDFNDFHFDREEANARE